MKKTLLIGSALVIGFAGYSQNNAKSVTPQKHAVKTTHKKGVVIAEGQNSHSNMNWHPTAPFKATASGCLPALHISDSWNPNGVGAGADCVQQNCLSYNQDLNAVVWIMRGAVDWQSAMPTSGGYEATIIQNVTSSASSTVAANTIDTVAIWSDSPSNLIGARYPGGAWLNPAGNTDWHQAYATVVGPYNAGSTWLGTAYVTKPLWSTSAKNHTAPSYDSLKTVSGSAPFYGCDGSAVFLGSPNCDPQQIGNTQWSTGSFIDLSVPASSTTPYQQMRKGFIAKAALSNTTTAVSWSIDSNAFKAKFYKGSCGYLNVTNPRLAFGPDGQTGYAVFIGRLDTTFGNSADSALTPILYKTTDGGTTWTHMLAGYDWICHHPEVAGNQAKGSVSDIGTNTNIYSFASGYDGVDVTVDANNVLHYVSTVQEAYHGLAGFTYSFDSLNYGGYSYYYDNLNHHTWIWDFMTDGSSWKTMLVDSLKSYDCGEDPSTDTTANYSSWTSSTNYLYIGAHLTVSRTPDGSKIFYGWADTDPTVNGFVDNAGNVINPNTNPDIWIKGYDVTANKLTPTTDIAPGIENGFFPFLADNTYYDANQSAWVVPVAYCVGRSSTTSSLGFPIYNGDGTSAPDGVNYFYTNCGAFNQGAFTTSPNIYVAPTGSNCAVLGIKTYNSNAFASSISNFPNPFSNTTTIAVTLTENKPVSIKVYNTIGDVVFTKTIDGNVGQNNVTFDGGQVSSGVYYYTVTAGNEQATKKMVIQK